MKKRSQTIFICLLFLLNMCIGTIPASAATVTISNGTAWTDSTGGSIQAHGGGITKVGSTYYWYGEDKIQNSALFSHVCCYSSTDLKNWTWKSYVLTTSSASELASCKIERPKVIYNSTTGLYVMWMHYENATDYTLSRVAVATSSTPTGPFTYLGSFQPNGGSHDMTIFKDDDGSAYLITASDSNTNTRLFKLSADYTTIASEMNMIYSAQYREAPALVKSNGYYYIITSACSGWYTNQQKYSYATSLNGPWSTPAPIGNTSGFNTQTSFILPIQGTTTSYMYMGDRWNSSALGSSSYVWLPLTLSGTTATMDYYDNITIDAAAGTIAGTPNGTLLSQGKTATAQTVASGYAASNANDGDYQTNWLATGVTWPHWWMVDLGASKTVKNVQISWFMYKGSEGYYQYKIETSTDGINFTTALDKSSNTTYGFTSDRLSVTARYVRINMIKAVLWNNPSNWYTPQLYEVKVYGA
jgi:hypothetical protein